MLKDKTYFSKSNTITTVAPQRELRDLDRILENTSLELYCIKVRELDKRYTYANLKRGKCTMDSCQNHATHWLTRYNQTCCQSDMVCHQHAKLWMEIKNIIN